MSNNFLPKYGAASPVIQVDANGFPVTPSIGRAYNYASLPAEDITLDKVPVNPPMKSPYFYVIPLVAGTIKVQLQAQQGDEYYTISEAEINAYIGCALPYRITKIIIDGTTVSSFSIAY